MSRDVSPEGGCEAAVRAGTCDSELVSVLCEGIALVRSAGQAVGFPFAVVTESFDSKHPS